MKKTSYSILLFLSAIYFLTGSLLSAQNPMIDTLKLKLQKAGNDTDKIEIMNQLRNQFMYVDIKASGEYALKMVSLAEKNGDARLKAMSYNAAGTYYTVLPDTVKAMMYIKKAIENSQSLRSPKGQITWANSLVSMGTFYHMNGRLEPAIMYYLNAEPVFVKNKADRLLAVIYSRLTDLFRRLNRLDKYSYYSEQLVEVAKRLNDLQVTIMAKNTRAGALYDLGKYDESEKMYLELVDIGTKVNNPQCLATAYFNLGGIQKQLKNYSKAIEYNQKSLAISNKQGMVFNSCEALNALAENYLKVNDYSAGFKYAEDGIAQCRKNQFEDLLRNILDVGAKCAYKTGKYAKAYEFLNEYLELYRKNADIQTQKQIAMLEGRFQAQKKETHILQLEAEKQIQDLKLKKRSQWIIALSAVSGLVIIILIIIYILVRHRRKISMQEARIREQKISELEKERQLIAARAVIQGEEKERTRLSRDLHDGLGGMLSGIKIKFSSFMKGNVVLPEESVSQFENALGLLDTTIIELRRIAHNMMPEALIKFGLRQALEDMCSQLGRSVETQISFSYFGEQQRFPSELEIAVYRIAQELTNNALKYAEASAITLNLIAGEGRLCLQVIDNGKGFDPEAAESNKGKGLTGIRNRISAFNGTFDLQSSIGSGTEVSLEFFPEQHSTELKE